MEQIAGIPTEICVDGKTLRNVKARGTEKPVYKNIYLLSSEEASRLFYVGTAHEDIGLSATCEKVKEAAVKERKITIGVQKVAEAPTDDDFENAAVYKIKVPAEAVTKFRRLLDIVYQGDCARLYANGKLIADNFNNGRHFLYGLWRMPKGCTELELRILPMQKDMPVYFPREADTTLGEKVVRVSIEPL